MLSQKAYLMRWLAASTKVAPFIHDRVLVLIQTSAKNAALQCSGSPAERPNGRMCGLSWSKGATWDGTWGVGQQMAALEAITGLLIQQAAAPVTSDNGGTSKGDPNAGSKGSSGDPTELQPPTGGEKAGAGILTAVLGIGVIVGLVWLSLPDGKVR